MERTTKENTEGRAEEGNLPEIRPGMRQSGVEVEALLRLAVHLPVVPDFVELRPHLGVQEAVQCCHEETLSGGEEKGRLLKKKGEETDACAGDGGKRYG